MSRRKQGKPQQRKKIDSLDPEADSDTLTCGACQTVFPLADIVRFIQHKINRCNKENVGPYEESNGFDDEESSEQDVMTVINVRRPSISAPIAARRSPDKLLSPSPRPSIDSLSDLPLGDETNCKKYDTKRGTEGDEEDILSYEKKAYHRQLDRKVKVAEVGVNTTATEPFKFICSTCKSFFTSAWSLVQHAQKVHNFKIYLEPSPPDTREEQEKKERLVSTYSTTKGKTDREVKPSTRSPTLRKSNSPALPTGVHEAFVHPHAPFMFPMPDRQPLSPALGPPGPFHRPPGDFRIDFIGDPFQHRMPVGGIPGIGMHRPPFEHPGLPPSYPYPFKRHTSVPEPPVATSSSSQGGSAEDFYSQRLRQLAHAPPPSSPSESPSPGQKAGSGLGQQQQSDSSAFSPSTSQPPPPPNTNGCSELLRGPQVLPPKQKACEFCGKCFRFQSNLIVHRRSHTGEKPFRCLSCPHACTQASKLKRHMKIHKKAGSNSVFTPFGANGSSDQSTHSPSSTPDSSRMSRHEDSFENDDSDMERQVEDDDEAAALEEELAAAEFSRAQAEAATGLHLAVYEENEEKSSMDVNEEDMNDEDGMDDEDELDEECESPDSANQKENVRKPSLLTEVMQNSGLSDIHEYNEAFRQALKDQNLHNDIKCDDKSHRSEISENGIKEEPGHLADNSRPGSVQHYDPSLGSPSKQAKLEPIEICPRDNNPFQRPELYSNPIWFPPTAMPPEFFMRHHGDARMMPRPHPLHHPNGSGLINHEVAFKINSTRKHGTNYGQLNATPTTAPSAPPVPPVRRRNDTCEFCGKIFKNCSNLTVHRRSHTGEKPYRCKLCSYACAQSSKLTRHMRTHGRLGKDIYRCKFCGMPFSVPSTLEKHMRKCVGNQQSGLMDHDQSGSGVSPTGMSPVGMSPVGSGHSPVGSLPPPNSGAFTPPSSGMPSPTSGTLPLAGNGESQQGKPSMMDLDARISPVSRSGHSPPSSSAAFTIPSNRMPSPTSGTLPLPSSGALP